MSDALLFLKKFLRHGTKIASLAPSSPWLALATVANVDWANAKVIVELGAGTGPITKVLAEKARPETRVIVLERDPDFSAILRERFAHRPNFDVIEGDVRDLAAMLRDRGIGRVDHIVSGLPVPSFPKDLQPRLLPGGRPRRARAPRAATARSPSLRWSTCGPLPAGSSTRVKFVFEPRNFPPPPGRHHCRGREGPRLRPPCGAALPLPSPVVRRRRLAPRPARTINNSTFHWYAHRRTQVLAAADPVAEQRRTLLDLVRKARDTRFGRDHGFASIGTVENFQGRVPLRTYERLLGRLI